MLLETTPPTPLHFDRQLMNLHKSVHIQSFVLSAKFGAVSGTRPVFYQHAAARFEAIV
jgi:hypothetical protein